ncbi:hypothetical protein GCM10027440_54280 [Nocardiopsis coralliicola]
MSIPPGGGSSLSPVQDAALAHRTSAASSAGEPGAGAEGRIAKGLRRAVPAAVAGMDADRPMAVPRHAVAGNRGARVRCAAGAGAELRSRRPAGVLPGSRRAGPLRSGLGPPPAVTCGDRGQGRDGM